MTAVMRWRVAWRRHRRVAVHEIVPRALCRDGVVLAQHVREGRFQRSLSRITTCSTTALIASRATSRAIRALLEDRQEYPLQAADLEPQGYVRLTDNWIELTERFLVARGASDR